MGMEIYYLVEHENGGFLAADNMQNWSRVTDFSKAMRFTYHKACNVLNSSFNNKERLKWKIVLESKVSQSLREEDYQMSVNEAYCSTRFDGTDYDWIWRSIQKKYFQCLAGKNRQLNCSLQII